MRSSPALLVLAVLAGLGLGLLYGWVLQPVEYYDTAPDSLRIDYRVDYVLMVAEAHQAEGDAARAVERLAVLGPTSPQQTVAEAIAYATDHGFGRDDLVRLRALAEALPSVAATPAIGAP